MTKIDSKDKQVIADSLFNYLRQQDTSSLTAQDLAQSIVLLQYLHVESQKIIQLVKEISSKQLWSKQTSHALKAFSTGKTGITHLEIAFSASLTKENADQVLWYAIESNNFTLAQQALQAGANPNYENVHKTTALLLACVRGWGKIVHLLLAHGAKARIIRNIGATSPLREAQLHGDAIIWGEPLDALTAADRHFTEVMMRLKLLGNVFSVQAFLELEGETFQTAGYWPQEISQALLPVADDFFHHLLKQLQENSLSPWMDDIAEQQIPALIACLSEIIPLLKQTERISKLSVAGLMAILDVGGILPLYGTAIANQLEKSDVKGHAWALLVGPLDPHTGKHQIYRCNRGAGAEGGSGILIGQLDRKSVVKWITLFKKMNNWKGFKPCLEPTGDHNFSHLQDLDRELKQSENSRLIQQMPQEMGNCSLTAWHSLLVAIVDFFLHRGLPAIAETLSHVIPEQCLVFIQQRLLNQHLDLRSHLDKEATSTILYGCYEKMKFDANHEAAAEKIRLIAQEAYLSASAEENKRAAASLSLSELRLAWNLDLLPHSDSRITQQHIHEELTAFGKKQRSHADKLFVRFLLNHVDESGRPTTIIMLLKWDEVELFSHFLSLVGHPNDVRIDDNSLLELSVQNYSKNCFQFLQGYAHSFENLTQALQQALKVNAYNGVVYFTVVADMILALIEAGADVNTEAAGTTALQWIINRACSAARIQQLLDRHAHVTIEMISHALFLPIECLGLLIDQIQSLLDPLLIPAAKKGSIPLIDLLIEKGASPHITGDDGTAPWIHALKNRHLAAADHLLSKTGPLDIHDSQLTSLLFELPPASYQWLVDKGIDCNTLNANGNNILTTSIYANKSLSEIQAYLTIGVDPNGRGPQGTRPLIAAIQTNAIEVATRLGVTVDSDDPDLKKLWNADLCSQNSCSLQSIAWLINKGFDVNARGENSSTMLIRASFFEYDPLVKMLLENPSTDINAQTEDGNTVLMHLVQHQRTNNDYYNEILKRQPDLTLTNNEGETVFDLAKRQGLSDYLQERITACHTSVPAWDMSKTSNCCIV